MPKKSGVPVDDLVKIFCALTRVGCTAGVPRQRHRVSTKKSPADHAPDFSYAEALLRTSLQSLSERRVGTSRKFRLQSQHPEPMKSVLRSETIQHD